MNVWQGDPPLPVLTRTEPGMYEWAPGPNLVYRIVRLNYSGGSHNPIWDVYFPNGKSIWRTSLRACRRVCADHYLNLIGEPDG